MSAGPRHPEPLPEPPAPRIMSYGTRSLALLAPLAVTLGWINLPAPAAETQDTAGEAAVDPEASCPIPGGIPADYLIREGETHFEHLWQLSRGGENAEGYWNSTGDQLVLQRRAGQHHCDRIYVTDADSGSFLPVSNGRGVTTCSYFMPGDQSVLFASTHAQQDTCPPPVDFSRGYVWAIHPEYDIFVRDLGPNAGPPRVLVEGPGYDAEATVSPMLDRIVFTSTRSGDLELWTCDLEGGDLVQVTDAPGYDGGAFFSHDGKRLVFRATAFSEDAEEAAAEHEAYFGLLKEWKVRPSAMELFVVDVDGSNRRQVTELGGANFAPYFFPGDDRILFASNHHDTAGRGRNFDLFAISVDGGEVEKITNYEGFDSFPMFSPDGQYLAFSSNRGGGREGETNLFVAKWR